MPRASAMELVNTLDVNPGIDPIHEVFESLEEREPTTSLAALDSHLDHLIEQEIHI